MPKSERMKGGRGLRDLEKMSLGALSGEITKLLKELGPHVAERPQSINSSLSNDLNDSAQSDWLNTPTNLNKGEVGSKILRYNRAVELHEAGVARLQKVKKLRDAEE